MVEAVELPGRRFCLGVQWHPEAGVDHRLFAAHVAAAGHGPVTPHDRTPCERPPGGPMFRP